MPALPNVGHERGQGMTSSPGQAPCILIVEDEFAIREALTEFLEEEGYTVAGTANGQEALEYLQEADPSPTVILLDLMMPVMNGQQFVAEQQRNPALAKIPVILLSAASDAHARLTSKHVAGYLDKPVRLVEVLQLLEGYCQPDPSAFES